MLVLIRTVVAAREREDQWIAALELAECGRCGCCWQRVIVVDAAGSDLGTHAMNRLSRGVATATCTVTLN
jgi:hypothetical protein